MMAAAPPAEDADDWVKHAMNDDVAVVSVLLDIRHSEPPPPLFRGAPRALKLEWSVRQRRSKHVPRTQSDVGDVRKKKKNKKVEEEEELTRASPTTPLSFSGATSVSGGASEESCKPAKPTYAARSKVTVTSCTTISKRPRKRKTLVQLKEEESLLLKERRNLKKELLTLRLNVEKQRATNENLKRIKLQQTLMKVASSSASGEAIWYQPAQVNAVGELTKVIDLGVSKSPFPSNMSNIVHEGGNCREAAFPLPDLNLPFEDNHNPEALC
ncbi:uncharacterized protein LOC126799010 [Argentina anserina]|uniref:uncharacterized protein LOC126799010 n=1 Tax=Argentina anserina TaxID=57926 RepID=UPI00217670C8|nr:uncharacterized protein LOC126799010 [Potentilla anserina]